jgi:putative colanic acid biosynthesis UDP-glucose lipid carrier transferase
MKRMYRPSIRAKILVDLLLLAFIIFLVRSHGFKDKEAFSSINQLIVLVCMLTWYFSGRGMGLYKDYRDKPFAIEWIAFVKSAILYALLISCCFYFLLSGIAFGRADLILHFGYILMLFPLQKAGIRLVFRYIRRSDSLTRKVLIVGAGSNGLDFYQQYVKDKQYGYELTGFIDERSQPSLNGHYLGKPSDIEGVLARHELDDIVITAPYTDDSNLKQIVSAGEKQGKLVRIIPDYQQFGIRKLQIDQLGSLSIITLRSLPLDVVDNKFIKRVFDFVFSLLVVVFVLSWLFPIIALLIKLESKGPVLFRQSRWGLNNKLIVCYKFRTMVQSSTDVDASGKYQQARANDPRITRVGAFLRKSNLDEMPQFLNVLLGSMSVVGPRPHPVPLNIQSKDSIENYMMRHWVKPGITGWAQVHGYRGETRIPYLMAKRVEYDVWYIENWTFWLDLQIIVQTIVNMVKGEENAY